MAVDPRTAEAYGLAVFEQVANPTCYGSSVRWTRNVARAVHNWPPGQHPSTDKWTIGCGASLLSIDCIDGVSSAWSIWRLLWNHNGADIDTARVELFSSSDWTASQLDITFEMQDGAALYERRGIAAMNCHIRGTLDLAGSSGIDFAGGLLLRADGTTSRLADIKSTRGDAQDFTISHWEDGWEIKKKP